MKHYTPFILLGVLSLTLLSTTADAGVYNYGLENNVSRSSNSSGWSAVFFYIIGIPVFGMLYAYWSGN